MVHYKVLLSGRDVTLCGKSGARRFGFFASSLVSAESRSEAEKIAREMTCHDLRARQDFEAYPEDNSRMHLEKLQEMPQKGTDLSDSEPRFTFFLDED